MKLEKAKNGHYIVTKELVQYIAEQYSGGRSQYSLAKEFGCHACTISDIMRKHNIKVRNNREQALKYRCNSDYFEVIDTSEKAYWLGWMYSDGYIAKPYTAGIAIATTDEDILESFMKDIEYNGNIYHYVAHSGYSQCTQYSRLAISDPKLCKDLIDKGCTPQKSLITTFPDPRTVPVEFQWDFIRGLFDGDGSVTQGGYLKNGCPNMKIKLSGTKELLEGVQRVFGVEHLLLYQAHKERNLNTFALDVGGNHQVMKILDTLYGSATRYLPRKYNKYKDYKAIYTTYSRAS